MLAGHPRHLHMGMGPMGALLSNVGRSRKHHMGCIARIQIRWSLKFDA